MAAKKEDILSFIYLLIFCIVFTWAYIFIFGGDTIFCENSSGNAVFHVDLQAGKNYELWILDANGPESVGVSISNGSYVPYAATFRLMHPEGDYLPYKPGFTVKETGGYDIVVHSTDSGTIQLQIRQDTGLNLGRII